MAKPCISVLIHTLNEADQIEECLRSVAWADEIYLIDAFSDDGTVELVREKFPQVVLEQRESLGSAAQKNYGMTRVRHDWVLVIDADERVTPELRDEIVLTLGSPRRWAYSIGRRNYILGKRVRYSGLQRDRVTRLFHRDHARYPNRRVHVDLRVEGEVGRLQESFEHHYVRSLDHMAAKTIRYGIWGGAQLHRDGTPLRFRDLLLRPAWRFFRDWVLNYGFLDGYRGLVVVGMHSFYTFFKYAKLWEFRTLERLGRPLNLPEFEEREEVWKLPWEDDSSTHANH
jgi:glycosyltransferase involved in cell wall biosynthesis